MSRGTGSKLLGAVLTLGLIGMGLGFLAGMVNESRVVDGPGPVFGVVIGGGIFYALLRGPIGAAIARMLETSPAADDQLAARVDELEALMAELGPDQQRVAELEERLDFAERLLAQRGDAAAVKSPEPR